MQRQIGQLLGTLLMATSVVFATYANATSSVEQYQVIEWIELMPEDDLEVLMNPPELVLNIEDGSAEDNVAGLGELSDSDPAVQRYYQALNSARVVQSFDKKRIRLPGFIVPLSSDEENKVTEFFIVPYFGACLHMPPPPPNQIVYATHDKGLELASLYDAFWFEGQLVIENKDHALGSSAYRIKLDSLYPYED